MAGTLGLLIFAGAIVVGIGVLVFLKIRWARAEARKWMAIK